MNDINFAAHISPFDVLLFVSEDLFDEGGGAGQTPHHIVGEDCAVAREGNLFDAAVLVKGQQAVFSRARQNPWALGEAEFPPVL